MTDNYKKLHSAPLRKPSFLTSGALCNRPHSSEQEGWFYCWSWRWCCSAAFSSFLLENNFNRSMQPKPHCIEGTVMSDFLSVGFRSWFCEVSVLLKSPQPSHYIQPATGALYCSWPLTSASPMEGQGGSIIKSIKLQKVMCLYNTSCCCLYNYHNQDLFVLPCIHYSVLINSKHHCICMRSCCICSFVY